MKKLHKILIIFLILISYCNLSFSHGGNISGWKDKNSSKITKHDGKYYGYHNEDGKRHYHEVEWDSKNEKWVILTPAVYYDENFDKISSNIDEPTEKVEVTFVKHVDGDTGKFKMNGKTVTVRFLGINTKETVDPDIGEEPYGKEGSNFTKTKLENANKIELEFDNNADKQDKYNRYLAWIWVDGELLQNLLVKEGLAETYMLQNNYKYAGLLQESEQEAKNEKLYIWSDYESTTTTNTTNSNTTSNEVIIFNEYFTISINPSVATIIGLILAVLLFIFKKFFKKKSRKKKRK